MRNRIIAIILAATFLMLVISSCNMPVSTDTEPLTEANKTTEIITEQITEPATEQITEPVTETTAKPIEEPDLFPDALTFDDLKTSATKLRFSDFVSATVSGDEHISVLVTLVQFTDGYKVNKEEFENYFKGEYDADNCIKSLSSYYKYSSGGKISFNFQFIYYDTGLTCAEAYHLVNDQDENGRFYGNKYIFDIFKDAKANNENYGIDYKSLDGDGNGYIDISFYVFAEYSTRTTPGLGHYNIYGSATGQTDEKQFPSDTENPSLKRFIKTSYEDLKRSPDLGNSFGPRIIIHETGHALGLPDYYDFHSYEGNVISTLGTIDMMDHDYSDHNAFSKFALGWIEPYVIDGTEDELTIKLTCSDEHGDVILIPTSKGWNGTAFDEYILIEICAPVGAKIFDWKNMVNSKLSPLKNTEGGIRIYHVDARLSIYMYDAENRKWYQEFLDDPMMAINNTNVQTAFYNTNGIDPEIEGQSRFYHLVEVVPSDRSSKFRKYDMSKSLDGFSCPLTVSDLFGPGDTFILDETNKSFTNAPYMNNGGTLDYSVTVEQYNTQTHEAVIKIRKINTTD